MLNPVCTYPTFLPVESTSPLVATVPPPFACPGPRTRISKTGSQKSQLHLLKRNIFTSSVIWLFLYFKGLPLLDFLENCRRLLHKIRLPGTVCKLVLLWNRVCCSWTTCKLASLLGTVYYTLLPKYICILFSEVLFYATASRWPLHAILKHILFLAKR